MSIYTHRSGNERPALADVTAGSTAVLGSIAVVLASAIAIVATLPGNVVLPAIALASAIFASVIGLVAWRGSESIRSGALTSAGIFALVAIGAAMLGDPDQVALYLK